MNRSFVVYLFAVVVAGTVFTGCRSDYSPPVRLLAGFPYDTARENRNDFSPTGAIEQLSENLYLFRDTCNVYVIRRGDRATLIDFGAGDIVPLLPDLGISGIDRVLVTHHHRDQLQGLGEMGNHEFRVTAPKAEAGLIENVEAFWKTAHIYLNYDLRSHWNSLRHSIRVDEKVAGGDAIDWKGIEFTVLETPGDTDHSVSYRATIDGRKVVFTGDLIAGKGKLHNWWDFHWRYYGFTDGINAAETSFDRVLEGKPAWLLPSHGDPIREPEVAVEANRKVYAELRELLPPNELHRKDFRTRGILPHLVYLGATSYAVISKSGKALLYDYGYLEPSRVETFKKEFGVREIDVVTYSHYHDDHIIRTYELDRLNHPEIWIYDGMADIFEHPIRYRLPCLIPFPIHADRLLHDGEKVRWEEYELEFFHLPGQTEYHQGLFTVIDGKRVLFTGDNTWKKEDPGKVRNGPIVPQNIYFLDGGFLTCARKMIEYAPDIVCPAHTAEYSPSRQDLEGFLGWAKQVREVMSHLILQPDANFGMDYQWCRFYPYRKRARSGEEFRVEVRIRNHLYRQARITVRLKHSDNILCREPERRFTVEPKTQVAVPFVLKKVGAFGRREVVTADLTINGHHFGEITEMLVD